MAYKFKNLVFEGGGVKGLGYVGAMKVLEQKGILPSIKRVGGTSAGAINALLFSLGYSNNQTSDILKELDFNSFLDDNKGVIRDTKRLIKKFGWYKGNYFHKWIGQQIEKKMGTPNATFRDLIEDEKPELYVYGANISTGFGEIFSNEHTPDDRIADAVRISMSIPLFFSAVKNTQKGVYVDGGLLNNYAVKLFDREGYINEEDQDKITYKPDYYKTENQRLLEPESTRGRYIYNKETLGFKLDTKEEIAVFRDGAEPAKHKVKNFKDYLERLLLSIYEIQANVHYHSDDWQRTIYIDTQGIGSRDFDISEPMKKKLIESGVEGTTKYFEWFDNPNKNPINRP